MSAKTVFPRFPDRAGVPELLRYTEVPQTEERVKSRKLPQEVAAKIVLSNRIRRSGRSED